MTQSETLHTHDGSVEVVIPEWTGWLIAGIGIGIVAWVFIEAYMSKPVRDGVTARIPVVVITASDPGHDNVETAETPSPSL